MTPPWNEIQPIPQDFKLDIKRGKLRRLLTVDATLRLSGLDAIADALGIARATVKTHLNRVYRETSTRNQAELIRMIAGING